MRSNLERMKPNVSFVCVACGQTNERYVVPSRQSASPARFCDRTCAGKWRKAEHHPRWSGGRTVDKDGYVYVHAPEHPHATRRGAVREHRLVMEAALGRYLTRDEVVHHENDDPGDNRIENLRLFATQAEHKRYHSLARDRDEAGRYVTV